MNKRCVWTPVFVLAIIVTVAPTRSPLIAGQSGDAERRRLDALEAGQRAILKELAELRALVQAQARPAPQPPNDANSTQGAPLALSGAASRGNESAKLTLLEFSDFQCPFCGQYAKQTIDQVTRAYVDTGKIRYVFRHYPIEKIHPNAFKAAEAGECARQQGKFWELHDRLFANQLKLADLDLLNHAKAVGVDGGAFQRCVVTPAVAAKIRQDVEEGTRAGVTGTPTFFIGTVQKDGKLKVLRRLVGAQPFSAFKLNLDAMLAASDIKS